MTARKANLAPLQSAPQIIKPLIGMPDLLPKWRRELTLEQLRRVPEWRRLDPNEQKIPVKQSAMGRMTGVSVRHYGDLERYGGPGFSTKLVRDTVRILGLTEAKAAALYRWTQHEPPTRPRPSGVHAYMRRLLHEIPHGAYFSDFAFNIVAYNELAALHWPWIALPDANIMKWALGPNTDSRAMLLDYVESWVKPMVAQIRGCHLREPTNQALREVITVMCGNRTVRDVWERGTDVQSDAQFQVRPMWLPTLVEDEPVDIAILSLSPSGEFGGLRLVVGMPADPRIKEPRLPSQRRVSRIGAASWRNASSPS